MWKRACSLMFMALLVAACGSDEALQFNEITGIPPGDGAGDALSGNFAVTFFYTSDGCEGHAELEIPGEGSQTSLDVEVVQDDGAISFAGVHVVLRGGVSFSNQYEAGGADLIDVGDSLQNVLRMLRVDGAFESANVFTGTGQERLVGSLSGENVDCTYSFRLEGTRKAD